MNNGFISLLFLIAEKLGRTVEELLHGSPSHRPLSNVEFSFWAARESIKEDYRKQAENKRASRKGRR